MNTRPAYEQVTIAHGGNTVTLRPSLRTAITLEARFGFPALFRALEDGSFTIISEIIVAASSSATDGAAFPLSEAAGRPLNSFMGAARMPLAQLVSMLMPAPVQSLDTKPKVIANPGKSVAWADYYADLYEKATGYLGWTPEQAWNATPTEIERAYSGLVAKLKAIHGSGDDKEEKQTDPEQAARNVEAGLDPDFDRSALHALRAKIAGGA